MKPSITLATFGLSLILPLGLHAEDTDMVLGGQSVTSSRITEAPMPGWKEVTLPSGEVFYTDPEQRYVILGTLFENRDKQLVNLTEVGQRDEKKQILNALPDEAFVTFPAKGKDIGTITVFTDTSCPYCQQLHQEIDALNAAGVTVQYLPFPRMGVRSPVAQELAEIWCSEDPQRELSTAFYPGRKPNAGDSYRDAWERCGSTIEQGYGLGQQFGVQGTPAIVLPSGEVGEGYLPADQLVQAILNSREG